MKMSMFRMMQVQQRLDETIAVERSRTLPDPLLLRALKRKKLLIRERLKRLMARQAPALRPNFFGASA